MINDKVKSSVKKYDDFLNLNTIEEALKLRVILRGFKLISKMENSKELVNK
jgi:hypothetical protein